MKADGYLKAEPENIFALTHGYKYAGKRDFQIMMVKTKELNDFFYILEPQVTTNFELSFFGEDYKKYIRRSRYKLQYGAYIDSIIKFSREQIILKKLFNNLYSSNFFKIWEPSSPIKYFNDSGSRYSGYIVLFRVFLMESIFSLSDYDKEKIRTSPRITSFQLEVPLVNKILKPVLSDEEFNLKKNEIFSIVNDSTNGLANHYKTSSNFEKITKNEYLVKFTFDNRTQEQILEISSTIEALPFQITEKESIAKVRIGQAFFKNKLKELRCKCSLCEIDDERLLIASHIKEWCESNNQERVDPNNGLLLCPLHDSLFDKHLISFKENGMIAISKTIPLDKLKIMNLKLDFKIEMNQNNRRYFQWHYNKFLKKEQENDKG